MLMAQMAFLVLLSAPFDLIRDYSVTYTVNSEGDADVVVSWTLQQPAEYIIVTRGQEFMEALPGDATSWTITEKNFGEFQYSIGWAKYGLLFQWETSILKLGKFVWDIPSVEPEGYVLFVADDPALLTEPTDKFIEIPGGTTQTIDIKTVMDAGLILPNIMQYAAMASYITVDGNRILSELSDPIDVEFIYEVKLVPWALPQKPENVSASW